MGKDIQRWSKHQITLLLVAPWLPNLYSEYNHSSAQQRLQIPIDQNQQIPSDRDGIGFKHNSLGVGLTASLGTDGKMASLR